MQATEFSPDLTSPFDPASGELLPAYRDAYVLGRLAPRLVPPVETYLKGSSIQTKVALGRYHELAAAARQQGRSFVAPPWVQQQLVFQPTVSKAGPLRRPVVRLAAGLFLVLGVASLVQWLRNEPLVPAPVVAAATRVAASASRATTRLVAQFTTPATPAAAPARPAKAPAAQLVAVRRAAAPETKTIRARTAAIAALAPDSMPAALPLTLPGPGSPAGAPAPAPVPDKATGSETATTAAPLAPGGPVRGRISDAQGRPLAGATVLVQGSRLGTSTNAAGEYLVEVPAGASLSFGYGGYDDETVRLSGPGTLNITLHPRAGQNARPDKQR